MCLCLGNSLVHKITDSNRTYVLFIFRLALIVQEK